jgi:hypothetical protein
MVIFDRLIDMIGVADADRHALQIDIPRLP